MEAYFFLVVIPAYCIGLSIILSIYRRHREYKKREEKRRELDKQLEDLENSVAEITPEEFIQMRNYSFGGRGKPSYVLMYNFAGVYILYNKTKDMYYVGQSKQVLNRVYAHFSGKGNGDVYADYKKGDSFIIKMIALENSGFSSLNALERNMIAKYNAFSKGYNKTRGNFVDTITTTTYYRHY